MDQQSTDSMPNELPVKPRYHGQDLSPTSHRELRGFYAYQIAAEVFAVCGVGSFLPVTLEQLARERGVLWSDKTTSCLPNPAHSASNVTDATLRLARRADENNQCMVRILNFEVTTSSFAMYTFSLAVFIQFLLLVSFSSVADYGKFRKNLLITFGITGALSSMAFIAVTPTTFLLGPLLVVIGVTCMGCSFVMLNSFLPLLVANHPSVQSDIDVQEVQLDATHERDCGEESEIPLPTKSSGAKADSVALKLSTEISSKAVGMGYVAAVFVQLLSIGILVLMSKLAVSSTLPLRTVLVLAGLWWLSFTMPAMLWLRDRPGPPLEKKQGQGKWSSAGSYVVFAWSTLWQTVKLAAKLRQTLIFLIAWFLLSDAVATVSGTAILFARTELKMGTVAVACLSITVTCFGIAGAFLWPIISRKFNLQSSRTILACIIVMEVIPLYGLLGFIPFIRSWGVGGLQQPWEIYPLGIIYGFVMGGLSAFCRSFFGQLIPPGREASFYALYAITDKGSSAIGPAVVGMIVDANGTIRPAFFFLAIMIMLPMPLVWMVDVSKGRADAIRMSEVLGTQGTIAQEIGDSEREELMNDHD